MWFLVCCDLPALLDLLGLCTNVVLTAYAHVRTEPQCDIGRTRGKKRLAPCDLGDPGWGDPWFPYGAFVASLTFWYGLVMLMFFRLFLLPYHFKMIQCYHLLHELAHELAPVTPLVLCCCVWFWVGCFAFGFGFCPLFVFWW